MPYKTYIFNPDNDLALAFGGENYTAPPMASRLRYDLQMLPAWYCDSNTLILADAVENAEWLDSISRQLPINSNIVKSSQLPSLDCEYVPWGWSFDMRKRLIDKGVECDQLPSKEYIDTLRRLSHRSISIKIHNDLREMLDHNFSSIPVELYDLESIKSFAKSHPCCYLKAPWSSSGKGVFRVLDLDAIDFQRWSSGVLSRQGSLMGEVSLDKVMDFAMEFYCEKGVTTFAGYSIFNNDNHCSFDSGLVMSTTMLHEKIISIYKDESTLMVVRGALENILTNLIAPHYTGYLGVDMLLYQEFGEIKLNPCVELNLRMTMGAVTSLLGNRMIADGVMGRFVIEYHKKSQNMIEYINTKSEISPVKYVDGKITSGIQFLTPIYNEVCYCAYLEIMR